MITDGTLFALLRGIILAGFGSRNMAGWDVARAYPPGINGANSTPTVYLFKIGDKRVGSPSQTDVWDDPSQTMVHTVSQQYETTLQASVLMPESTDPAALTASDALSTVADMIQTDEGQAVLVAAGVGVLRVTDVRNPYNVNDSDQFAAGPSFDLVLTYRRTYTVTAPVVDAVLGNFDRV